MFCLYVYIIMIFYNYVFNNLFYFIFLYIFKYFNDFFEILFLKFWFSGDLLLFLFKVLMVLIGW